MFYNNRRHYTHSIIERNRKIQEIYKDEMNNECFDCGKTNPQFISANNGVFICKNCMVIHYQFSDEVSLIIKNNLFLLNEEQINYIYFGGNRKLLEFINYEFPQLQNYQPEILYKTFAMQYYRDKLYYLVEGGAKPIKPNVHFAYKLINNYANYPMTEKRGKYGMNEENQNEFDNYYLNKEKGKQISEEDELNSNKNIINFYSNNKIIDISNNSSFVYVKNKMNRNNSFTLNKICDRSLTNFNKNNIKIREPEYTNFLTNNNSNSNFYQKRDKFFKEMNRLFGGEDEEEEYDLKKPENLSMDKNEKKPMIKYSNNKTNQNNKFYKTSKMENKYLFQKRLPNINYNNYIKNTININNNNTNIYMDEDHELQNQNNLLSKSQLLNNEIDNNNFTFGHAININNNINNMNNKILSNNKSSKIIKIKNKKKINMAIKKKVYIRPKVVFSFNQNKSNSPSITQVDNNYNSIPIDELSKAETQKIISSSDCNERDNLNDSKKKEKIAHENLSQNILSPICKNAGNPQIFNKKKVNYSKNTKIKKNKG